MRQNQGQFSAVKGINFGSHFQFFDTAKRNQNVKSKLSENCGTTPVFGKSVSSKELPISKFFMDALNNQGNVTKRSSQISPQIQNKSIKIKPQDKIIKKSELNLNMSNKVQILQLK